MANYIDRFLEALAADGKSKCTVSAYQGDLNGFCAFADSKDLALPTVRYADLRDWANEMESQGLSASTRARKISAVKSFYKYLMKMEQVERSPAEALEMPKQEKKQPSVISTEDAKNLLDYARHDAPKGVTWFRDYAVVALFLFTGVRREELTNIKLTDVDLQTDTILIHGKGNKQRQVYVNSALHAILAEYLYAYRALLKSSNDSEYLFTSVKSAKMSVRAVNDIVNKAFEAIGIKEEGVSVHNLRKRFATSLFANTGDIATTSKLLGHSSPTVTMRYVVIDENTMRSAANTVSF